MSANRAADSRREPADASEGPNGLDDPDDRVVAVPCEGDDVLALFALETGDPLGEVPVGSHPVHAVSYRGRTFVATMGERAVTAVAPDGEVTRIETGVLGPSHFAAANGALFVSCSAGDALAVVDPESLTLTGRIAVGAEPHEVAASPDGDRLFSGSRRDGVVDIVGVAARERLGAIDVGDDARVQGVALSPDGTRGYAVDQRGPRVVAFDPSVTPESTAHSSGITGSAEVGADPYDLVVTDERAFVPGRGDGVVHEFDRDLTRRAVHHGFDRPVDLFRIDGDWWVLDAETPRIRSLAGDAVETPAPGLVGTPVDLADGRRRLVVSHYDDDRVSLVDLGDGVVWTAETPAYPFGSVVV
ncbi:YncE family protein [Halorubrum sp. DTA46]|uniref:YncE family protein n=1 Tax=Halorubrum sp. DTA46 TaxID=3402162 RepID=UPI003AAB1040